MSNLRNALAGALLAGTSIALMTNVASATPATHALALKSAAPSQVETVRWGRGWGWGLGGFAAGAIIGSAIAAPYYYGGYYGYGPYYPGPYYPGPYYPAAAYPPAGYGAGPVGPGGPAGGNAAAYCAQRYHSYDPRTGTFLGTDGARHPCP